MLNRASKEVVVNKLKDNIDKSKAVFLTNLIGLKSNDGVGVRKQVRDAKGDVVITRNTLFKKAAEGTACEKMVSELTGPHALAFAFEDAAAVAKCLNDASKEYKDVVTLKSGVLNGRELSKEELVQLANLPSRDQMLGTLLATFSAPVSAFARVIHAIGEQKAEGTEAVETEVVETKQTEE